MTVEFRGDGYDPAAFAEALTQIGEGQPQKYSSRGWAYILEGMPQWGATKADFDLIQDRVNDCRAAGLLPIDFVLEEEARAFSGVENPEERTPEEYLAAYLVTDLRAEENYTPDWWDGETYYIQMVVEKIDLREMFGPTCAEYHIPIATSKGWSSMLQRAEYARRFKEAEERGLKCVLLYCGDHDPDGLRISDKLRKNLSDLRNVQWSDGTEGYDPSDLVIDRFALNYDFIIRHRLPWIENLYTGSRQSCRVCGEPMRLDDPHHPNNRLPYVQDYIRRVGVRKCEANALVQQRDAAIAICRGAIERYLGPDARERFEGRRQVVRDTLERLDRRTHYKRAIRAVLETVQRRQGGERA